MITQRRLFAILLFCTTLLASGSLVFAQEKRVTLEGRSERIGPGPETQLPGDNIGFVGSEFGFSFDGKVVKGAPYSGQAVTEITQTLGDGNRIVNRSTASVYRDKEGRTRREQTIGAIGPLLGQMPQTIFINDPVAGVSYILEPNAHVARKMMPMQFEYKLNTNGEKVIHHDKHEIPLNPPEIGTVHFGLEGGAPGAAITMELNNIQDSNGKQESLGKQTIEGIEAEGVRTTITIHAGEIGK